MTTGQHRSATASAALDVIVAFLLTVSTVTLIGCRRASNTNTGATAQPQQSAKDPWTGEQTVQPADLVKELANSSPATRPTVVYIGFPSLYRAGHVPGATFHGPAASAEGLADLKRWAEGLGKSTDLVLYCGCCPLAECPNVRPAFTALHDMGFTRIRVLILASSFASDWAGRGYPVER